MDKVEFKNPVGDTKVKRPSEKACTTDEFQRKDHVINSSRETLLSTLSEAELAARLGISRVTAWRLRRSGKLSYYRVGRSVKYGEQHVAEYLASCEYVRAPNVSRQARGLAKPRAENGAEF
jgi:excisionase family DNA binding protein